jgi:hypothetical protein
MGHQPLDVFCDKVLASGIRDLQKHWSAGKRQAGNMFEPSWPGPLPREGRTVTSIATPQVPHPAGAESVGHWRTGGGPGSGLFNLGEHEHS